jgi:hypothetical protein
MEERLSLESTRPNPRETWCVSPGPLVSRSVVVNLIGNTRTKAGLKINAELDTNTYPTGLKVTKEQFATIKIKKARFHGEWNYTISPR